MNNLWTRITEFFGWRRSNEPCKLNEMDIRAIAKDAIEKTGSGNYLRRLNATKDPDERQRLTTDWETKMAERKGRSIS